MLYMVVKMPGYFRNEIHSWILIIPSLTLSQVALFSLPIRSS